MTRPNEIIKDCGLIVLAGGLSSRMGADKGLLKFGGHSFVQSIIKQGEALNLPIFISVGKHNADLYKNLGYPLLVDKYEQKGPVSGLSNCLLKSDYKWNFVVAVDSPGFSAQAMLKLWCDRGDYQAVVFGVKNDFHPLNALYQSSCGEKFNSALKEDRLRVKDTVQNLNVKYLSFEDLKSELTNYNYPNELINL